jgi:hypothetical protein
MLRAENPFNDKLTRCTTFAVLPTGRERFDWQHRLLSQFLNFNGVLEEKESAKTLLKINHSHLDGLGTLFFLHKIMRNSGGITETSTRPRLAAGGMIDGYEYRQVTSSIEAASSEQTFTQKFIASLLRAEVGLLEEDIGFVINVADPSTIGEQNLWGNGIIIDMFKGADLKKASSLSKNKWRRLLNMRAAKTLAMIAQFPNTASDIDSLVISSIGDLTKLPWASDLNPSNFQIFSTPMCHEVANLILWSRNGVQCLAACASPDHWIFDRWENVVRAWRET